MGATRQSDDSCSMPSNSVPLTVFLADDSAPIRLRVKEMLREQDLNVVGEAETPQSSINAILQLLPDVVVLDIQLRGGSGMQVLREVRKAAPGVAFVVFSNNASPAYRKRYLSEGAMAFLDKSIELDQLAKTVATANTGRKHDHCNS